MRDFRLDQRFFEKKTFVDFSKKYKNNQTSPIIKNYIFYEECIKLKS